MNRAFSYHPLSKITVKEKFIFNLTYPQTGWMLFGLFLSMKMSEFVPKLPFSMLFAYVHYLIPLLICSFFAFVEHKTGLSYAGYILSFRRYKKRKKIKIDH
ncbi:hypothetical protein AN619_29390 [Thermotalea metallivorans]|uniref:PrgI family protein n=1 Tax=Thermotalea metallivorans TaxID=520762 RepID=A0A140KZJ6_9FIRM|nr:hypothetical protein AN619_29390 [Thermotalea metallivorans]